MSMGFIYIYIYQMLCFFGFLLAKGVCTVLGHGIRSELGFVGKAYQLPTIDIEIV